MLTRIVCILLFLPIAAVAAEPLPPILAIRRVLPPEGVPLPEEGRAALESRLQSIAQRIEDIKRRPPKDARQPIYLRDILIFTKAVDLALKNQEFYDAKKDLAKANTLLDEAQRRLDSFEQGKYPWTTAAGLVVRGFESHLDGSVQPYGVVFPKDYDPRAAKKYPLYVWLHGRGDKATDLHFIHERMTQVGQLGPVDAIVIHPFGRQCVGFKGPGEIDVIECRTWFLLDAAREGIPVDPTRVVLIGFSMGGAGAWQVGAHRAGRFIAVSPGAGFAETALYTHTDPETVPWYERKLWGVNDVPCYTRNLFNTRVIAYSGEKDKQIQAARVMEEAFRQEGRQLEHLIGPDVEHRYEPKTLDDLKQRIASVCREPQAEFPAEVHLQTRTLGYGSMHWITLHGLERHWDDTRLDAKVAEKDHSQAVIVTKNVTRFEITQPKIRQCLIDGELLQLPAEGRSLFEKVDGKWTSRTQPWKDLRKDLLCHGPIDDAFCQPFLVVTPSGKSKNPLVQRWVEFELAHFTERWRTLMRADLRQKKDTDVTATDIAYFNLVCFGDPESNAIIRNAADRLPVTWKEGQVVVGEERFPGDSHVPALIYPNPLQTEPTKVENDWVRKYIVINSGLTYREAHDRTNSQQNPKLPDWAVIDLSQLPDDKSPGRIAAAGFFDEAWK